MAEKIQENLYWIGVDNPEGRDFHGIQTPRGGSYNSYLLMGDEPILVDATGIDFIEGYMESLRSVIDPKRIAYIIINHAEPDHTGALREVMAACPDAKVVCTAKCKEFLYHALGIKPEMIEIEKEQDMDLGGKKVRFMPHPMIHWPETMMTYLPDEKVLFSGDLFGTEISHEHLFADQMEPFNELTRDYFAIVMRPFHMMVMKAIEKVRALQVELLCPSHGPVYRKDIPSIVDTYERLAAEPEEDRVCIIYCSIWHSSERMAHEISLGIQEAGGESRMFDLMQAPFVTLMAECLTSKAVVLGSLTILGGYHPLFEALFPFLKLNDQKGKKAGVFGSYGWVSAAVPKLKKKLGEIEYDVVDTVECRFGPTTDEDLKALRDFGKKMEESTSE